MKLLIVEDDPDLVATLRRGLEREGYTVDAAPDGREGERMARAGTYELLVVDWMLPHQDGPTLVRRLRAVGVLTPALMLTAHTDVDDRVAALEAGADDYLAKPFAFKELFARLRALRRRAAMAPDRQALVRVGPLTIDARRHQATVHGAPLDLRNKEYELLKLLARRGGEVVPRALIAGQIWSGAQYVSEHTLNVTISSLRQKLKAALAEHPEEGLVLKTVRGVGYCLERSGENGR